MLNSCVGPSLALCPHLPLRPALLVLWPLFSYQCGVFAELCKARLGHTTLVYDSRQQSSCSCPNHFCFSFFFLCCFIFMIAAIKLNMFTFWFQKAGKVRCSLTFSYRPWSMIKTDGFRKYVVGVFSFLSFIYLFINFLRKTNNRILLAFFRLVSSFCFNFFFFPFPFS